jgi:hypothetical protein
MAKITGRGGVFVSCAVQSDVLYTRYRLDSLRRRTTRPNGLHLADGLKQITSNNLPWDWVTRPEFALRMPALPSS